MSVLKIRATQLRDAIRPVAPLAAHTASAPGVLGTVRLWTGDGCLYAACTDMLVGGIERTEVAGAEPGFETCVDVDDLGRHVELVAPAGVGYNPTLILEATPGGLVGRCEPYATNHPASTFHLQAYDPAVFPRLEDQVAKAARQSGYVDQVALRTTVLARFVEAEGTEPLRFRFVDDRHPVLVSGGDSFLGLVMPARLHGFKGAAEFGQNLWPDLFGGAA